MFGFGLLESEVTPDGFDNERQSELTPGWEEFPWRKYLIEENII